MWVAGIEEWDGCLNFGILRGIFLHAKDIIGRHLVPRLMSKRWRDAETVG